MTTSTLSVQLSCPHCATQFRIARAALGEAGRDVRCSRCAAVWHATPGDAAADGARAQPTLHIVRPETVDAGRNARQAPRLEAPPLPAEETPPLVPQIQPDAEEAEIEAAEPPPAAPARAPRRPTPRSARRRLLPPMATLVAILALAALAGLYAGRQHVVRWAPSAAAVFQALGVTVNLRGMTFTDLKTSREVEDGVPVLLVEGTIRSVLAEPADLPRLRLGLKSAGGTELYSWTAAPPEPRIAPRGALPFRARLASPPEAAESVEVRFLDRTDLAKPR